MCWNSNPVEVFGSLAISFMRGVISLMRAVMDLLTVGEHQVLRAFAGGSRSYIKHVDSERENFHQHGRQLR